MNMKLLGTIAVCMVCVCAQAQSVDTMLGTNFFLTYSEPHAITVDDAATIYVTDGGDGNRILKYSSEGFSILAGKEGTAGSPAGTADGFGAQARFNSPQGIVIAGGRLVVADSRNHVLRSVSFAGTVRTLSAPSSTGGYVDGLLATAQFKFPMGLAADTNGNVYVADRGNRVVRKVSTNGVVSTVAASYSFGGPCALAVGDNGDLWVADSVRNMIYRIDTNEVVTPIAGGGSEYDAPYALDGQFTWPSGLLWMGAASGLVISDTGNNTLRRLFYQTNSEITAWSLETVAGMVGQSGYVDAKASSAKFSSPMGLAIDNTTRGVFVVDSVNHAVRRFRQSDAPLVKISNPKVGYVEFVNDGFGFLSRFVDQTGKTATFNNDVPIVVMSENGTETFFTFGPTPLNPFNDTVPNPPNQAQTPPPYVDGLREADVTSIFGTLRPEDVTVKALSKQDGRPPSDIVKSQFQFKVANPVINGNNAASMSLNNITESAEMWYTLDGTVPENRPPSFGPIVQGQTFSIVLVSNVTIRVRGFKPNYTSSGVVQQELSLTNCIANQITFGFENGEASSDFVAAAGQRFYAPVTLSLLPGQKIYSLQFNLALTNVFPEIAPVNDYAYRFESMLLKPIAKSDPVEYTNIPPALFDSAYYGVLTTNSDGTLSTNLTAAFWQTDLLFTNHSANLLGVGWLERYGKTNLYDTLSQDLISMSAAHDLRYESKDGKVIVGGYSFQVPATAYPGQAYRISLGLPSGTEDGISKPAFIQAPTNGSLASGAVNSIKIVTVGIRKYIAGDVAPFRWFNAGDFGETNLSNPDVMQVFQTATYRLNGPPEGSDFYDAMDSSDGSLSYALDGDDTLINNIKFGDGQLNVDDIYVTFRRSADPSLVWYARYWSNGVRQAEMVLNPARSTEPIIMDPYPTPSDLGSRSVKVVAKDILVGASRTLNVPITAQIAGDLPIRVMMMGVRVVALDGSPEITNSIQFSPESGLGTPDYTDGGAATYAAVWYSKSAPGVWGTNLLGNLTITLPESATTNSAYLVHFDHFSASPNGIALFPSQAQDSLITLINRSASSWNDGIADSLRLRYFGTVSNLLSAADIDYDGDGLSNLKEFLMGTNPNDVASPLQVFNQAKADAKQFTLQWPTVLSRRYRIEYSDTLFGTNWTVIASNLLGDGTIKEFVDTNAVGTTRFYRVQATP